MNELLAGDPAKGGTIDFEGLMKACGRPFGTATQANVPARWSKSNASPTARPRSDDDSVSRDSSTPMPCGCRAPGWWAV